MAQTFFFYDLETSGINPREARVMQFAGRRTTLDLKPLGDPYNLMIKMTEDVLPEPEAVLLTGITPQQTISEGMSEAEFLKIFINEIATPETIFVGYNTIRFDDEFMRFTLWRNFYDAYEWQWKEGRSRWDLLDAVRMTRALRPDGIEWPCTSDGKPTNRLELITSLNGLGHEHAHDAMSDVDATISVAKLIMECQPKLFAYLLKMRDKKLVQMMVDNGRPFVYCSGRYSNEFEKTTLAVKIANHPNKTAALVYDLRYDPTNFLAMSEEQLFESWQWSKDKTDSQRLPVKTLQYNRCPAIAPLSVLDADSKDRLGIDESEIKRNFEALQSDPTFSNRIVGAASRMDKFRYESSDSTQQIADARLYDGFLSSSDKMSATKVTSQSVGWDRLAFDDERLTQILPLYKARNFPKLLSVDEHEEWESFRREYLLGGEKDSRIAKYFTKLQVLASDQKLKESKKYLLEELQLWGQSILPETYD